jgi:photosystem II stability/assembly factor-like uncharacterized protein
VTSLTLFAGTDSGLWRSRDWGTTWERADKTKAGESLIDLGSVGVIWPVAPQVYVGGDGGLYASDDFGESWRKLAAHGRATCLLFSRYPQADPTVFLGTADGLLKSVDGGQTFRPTRLGGARVNRLEWPGPALIAATSHGVVISLDAAETFSERGTGLPEGDVLALALSSFFAVDPVLFAGLERQGLYRSGDGGRTWTPAGLSGTTVSDLVWLGPILYAATDTGLMRSPDAGRTWAPLGEGLDARPLRLLFPLAPASGTEIFVGTDKGVYHSADGGEHWSPTGMKEAVRCVATFPPPEPSLAKRKKK